MAATDRHRVILAVTAEVQQRSRAAASTSGPCSIPMRPLLTQLWLKAPFSPLSPRGRSAAASSRRSAARAASCIA